ncbi:L,D-transpeptidase [Mycobacterium paraterrae]|uniref:L,D-transpeptidase n=1 Tax=Mycobacterium paraterrae TaxID=577492 RepID=A0ABY3VPZ1_9MYCO|nr:L,D-transpeptidase [Mycobacterium paraterrae]UMB69241.1 L,D-transpeptidase [Mycobacterium paraterrae]
MSRLFKGSLTAALSAVGVAAALAMGSGVALADPEPPPPPAPGVDAPAPPPPGDPAPPPAPADPLAGPPPGVPAPPVPGAPVTAPGDPLAPSATVPGATPVAVPTCASTCAGQNPAPFTGQPPFVPPTFNPVNGATVGVAEPIIINFARPIADKPMAEQAIHVSSTPPVPGKFYWLTPSQVRWRPNSFWPAHTAVHVDAAGTQSNFVVGDALQATADDATHQLVITRNGTVEQTFPMSMGMAAGGHQTPNGTYYVLDKKAKVVMDSSTYGVPVNSTYGYKVDVEDAVQFDNSGDYVHSAPWSVADQGKRDVSHGCINISPTNAKWFFANFGTGDPIIVKNSVGNYSKNDGSNDWQLAGPLG